MLGESEADYNLLEGLDLVLSPSYSTSLQSIQQWKVLGPSSNSYNRLKWRARQANTFSISTYFIFIIFPASFMTPISEHPCLFRAQSKMKILNFLCSQNIIILLRYYTVCNLKIFARNAKAYNSCILHVIILIAHQPSLMKCEERKC